MAEEEKNIIEEFINKPEYFNIDNKYWKLVEAVKHLYNSYNGEQHSGNHIPRID